MLSFLVAACDCVPCPDSYTCVLGHCVLDPSREVLDLAVEPPSDVVDLAISVPRRDLRGTDSSSQLPIPDLAMPHDLAPPKPDLAKGCVAAGGDCTYHKDSVCCSHYCVYKTNKCK